MFLGKYLLLPEGIDLTRAQPLQAVFTNSLHSNKLHFWMQLS